MNWSTLRETIENAPSDKPLHLRNLRTPQAVVPDTLRTAVADGLCAVDMTLVGGKIVRIDAPDETAQGGTDMGQRMVWPTTVDCHTHIDKGQVWSRSPNTDGTFAGAIGASRADSEVYQTAQDVAARADFALRTAFAHGTSLLRTHVDVSPETFDRRFGILDEVAQQWAGRIDVQLCPFTGAFEDPDWLGRLARAVKTQRQPTLSIFLQKTADLDAGLDRIFRCAIANDVALDFHADENLDPESDCLEAVAKAALRHGYDRSILVGHCCSLSVQSEAQIARTLDLVAKTQIGIVALPLCNLYLQDRQPKVSPRQRGIAPLKDIKARGIPVALASDNARDAFYAYGDLDVPDLFRDAMRTMQLDHPVGDWPATVTTSAADMIGRPDLGRLSVGGAADLILFSARNWSEFTARTQHDRILIRNGRFASTTPPDFSDLDSLQEMAP